MRRRHVLVAVAACGLVCLSGAQTVEPSPFGFPKEEARGGVGAFRIWYDDGAWHLRTSTENSAGKKEALMIFTGSVRCDGKLTPTPVKLESGGGKTSDKLLPSADGKGFDFDFRTFGATDEVTFKTADAARTLTFKLKIDGQDAPPFRILIGAKGDHPDKNEFKLPARPKK